MHKAYLCQIPRCLCHTDPIYHGSATQQPSKPAPHTVIMLIELSSEASIVPFDQANMGQLPAVIIDPAVGQMVMDFEMKYGAGEPLYFVRSRRYPGYYYPVRNRKCRCLEFQDFRYCDHVRQVADFRETYDLPANASSSVA